jgi:hypothetical protein
MGYEKTSQELRTGASNSKATLFKRLFGKTFSPEKVFVLPRFTKSANLSCRLLSVMKEAESQY